MADLEATIEEKNERTEELEADNRAPREQLDACEEQLEELEQRPELETGAETGGEDDSIWTLAKRFVRDGDE